MANDLAILDEPTKVLSLPAWLAGLGLGTVNWPGQPTRTYLAGGSSLTPNQRAEVETTLKWIEASLSPGGAAGVNHRAAILAKMIMGLGGAALTEKVAQARAEFYREAVDDLPAWAVAAASRAWARGDCGDHNYAFPPSPAVLRSVARRAMVPYEQAESRCRAVIEALTLERAMDSKPIADEERPRLAGRAPVARLRSM